MSHHHPSRRHQIPPPPPAVYLVPSDLSLQWLRLAERSYFNQLRIDLVTASYRYLVERFGPDGELPRHVRHWVWKNPEANWSQLIFENMPPIHDVHYLPLLSNERLVGVYWLVNHCDNEGLLSCGQIYDLMCSLILLEEILTPLWPRGMFGQIITLLRQCSERACTLVFTSREPTPPQTTTRPAVAFGYATAEAERPLDVAHTLRQLKSLMPAAAAPPDEPYDPNCLPKGP